jgi:hypothetical protein
MALFLPNCLAATDEVATEVIIKPCPVRFPFSDLEEIEKTEFSSLVYRIGSKGGNLSEIEDYCAERASYYESLAQTVTTNEAALKEILPTTVSPLHAETSRKWSDQYKQKALQDVGILRKFYQESDVKMSAIEAALSRIRLTMKTAAEKTLSGLQSNESTYVDGLEKIRAQKLQADTLFHHFYKSYDAVGVMGIISSSVHKASRFATEGRFCRPVPDFTIPAQTSDKDFFDFYDALVPMDARVALTIKVAAEQKGPEVIIEKDEKDDEST